VYILTDKEEGPNMAKAQLKILPAFLNEQKKQDELTSAGFLADIMHSLILHSIII